MPGPSPSAHPEPAPAKAHLVICRVDARSIHRSWLGDPRTRSYDVWLDCFGDGEGAWEGEPARVSVGQNTTKFRRIQAFARERPELRSYEYVWLPDDDVRLDPAGLEALFATMRAHGLDLAQPALLRGSHTSHLVTLQHSGFQLRYTNFVEMMAPAFSGRALATCLEGFSDNVSGLGMDLAWSTMLGRPRDRIAVIDAIGMAHTRPVGVAPDVWWAKLGLTLEGEVSRICERRGVAHPYRMEEYGGISRSGRPTGTGLGFLSRLVHAPEPGLLRRGRYWKRHVRALRDGRAP